MNKIVGFFFFFLNNLISNKAQHTEGTMVKVIWVSQKNSLEFKGVDGFKQWSPLSRQTLNLKRSLKVWSQSEEFQQARGLIRQDCPSGKKTK